MINDRTICWTEFAGKRQYITLRYTEAEVEMAATPLQIRIAELEARLSTKRSLIFRPGLPP